MKIFQVCYEGDLTIELASAVRRLKGEPNFDNSWEIQLDTERDSRVISRFLSRSLTDGNLFVAEANPSRSRDYLLVRHSVTAGFDYAPLHRAMSKLGLVLDLPLQSMFIIRTSDRTQAHIIGDRFEELCPYDSLMVTGISADFTIWSAGMTYTPSLRRERQVSREEQAAFS